MPYLPSYCGRHWTWEQKTPWNNGRTTNELQTRDATMATCTLYSSAGLALCEGLGFAGVLQPDHPPQLTDWQKIATLHPCFWTQELPSSLQHVFSLNHHPPFFICSFPIFSGHPRVNSPGRAPTSPGLSRPTPAALCWAPRRRRHAARLPGAGAAVVTKPLRNCLGTQVLIKLSSFRWGKSPKLLS